MSEEQFENRVRKHLSLIRPHLDRIPRAYQVPNITLDESDLLANLVAAVREEGHGYGCAVADDPPGPCDCVMRFVAALDEAGRG